MLRTHSSRWWLQGVVAVILLFAASTAYAQTTSRAEVEIGASHALALSTTKSFVGPGNAVSERSDRRGLRLVVLTGPPHAVHALESTRLSLRAPVVGQPQRRDSVLNGTIIGEGVGAGYGIFVVTSLNNSSDSLGRGGAFGVIATTVALGAGVGALVDYLRR